MFNTGDKVRKIDGLTDIGEIFTISTAFKDNANNRYILRFEEIDGDWNSDFFELAFPAKWCIKTCPELEKWALESMKGQVNCTFQSRITYYFLLNNSNLKEWAHFSYALFDNYVTITFKQFKEFILKEKITPMKNLNLAGYRKLHAAACNDWKSKLERRFGTQLLLNDEIEIIDTDYDMMRNACDATQHKVMDEVFGPDHIKKGTPCLVSHDNKLWVLRYANGVGSFTQDKVNNGYHAPFEYFHQTPYLDFLPD